MHKRYEKLAQRGKEFLGVEHPIMCGAMTWISDAKLVSVVAFVRLPNSLNCRAVSFLLGDA